MKFISTRNKFNKKNFSEAVIQGLAEDGGLFVPENIEQKKFNFKTKGRISFNEVALEIAKHFLGNEFRDLKKIVNKAFDFAPEVVRLNEFTFILELFHGPSLAFKDFGARFLSEIISEIADKKNINFTILVATSGDTGSAVAKSFFGKNGINVVLLYPSNKITILQRKQITSLGKNIFPFEIKGTFDDCQNLVKRAFLDNELRKRLNLISANSINIGRLIPQIFYYYYAFERVSVDNAVFVVPSGNLGNLTAGILAKKMGLKISRFIAATNSNKAFKEYLKDGKITSVKVVQTISNAMDVMNPSNLERIEYLFNYDLFRMNEVITAYSVTDEETLSTIEQIYLKYKYLLDPHSATALTAWRNLKRKGETGIVLATAHPAKFINIYKPSIAKTIDFPQSLNEVLGKNETRIIIENNYKIFKKELLELF